MEATGEMCLLRGPPSSGQAPGGQGCRSVPTVGIGMVILRCQHGLSLLAAALLLLGCPEGLGCSHFQGLTQGLALVRTLRGHQAVASRPGVLGEGGVLSRAPHSWV